MSCRPVCEGGGCCWSVACDWPPDEVSLRGDQVARDGLRSVGEDVPAYSLQRGAYII